MKLGDAEKVYFLNTNVPVWHCFQNYGGVYDSRGLADECV